MRILIAGANGFVGQHTAKLASDNGHEVVGISTQPIPDPVIKPFLKDYICCDLVNVSLISKIDLSEIDAIINLAGLAKVGESIGQGGLYNKVNIGAHTVLYNECLIQGVTPRIIAVSTGAVYDPNQQLPITEESALITQEKTNEYVISKQLMEKAMQEFRDKGLRIIIVRPFNHTGPGQLPGFLLPDLGQQIVEALQSNKPLLVGNLDTKRDYTDVRDVARAYVELATAKEEDLRYDCYNVCSGVSVQGRDILSILLSAFNATNVAIEVDQSKIRPNDVMDIYGSYERLREDTGWSPKISTEDMVKDYANWVRQS